MQRSSSSSPHELGFALENNNRKCWKKLRDQDKHPQDLCQACQEDLEKNLPFFPPHPQNKQTTTTTIQSSGKKGTTRDYQTILNNRKTSSCPCQISRHRSQKNQQSNPNTNNQALERDCEISKEKKGRKRECVTE